MKSKFATTPRFDRSLRQLKKRYPKIGKDLTFVFEDLENNPEVGTVIPKDYSIRKVRVRSSDMQRGKSGGFRLLYRLADRSEDEDEIEITINLLFIYAKVDQKDVSQAFLQVLDEDD
ncbi:MAG: hypothetical protein RLP44_10230 [Aggregatilineales bacterium]